MRKTDKIDERDFFALYCYYRNRSKARYTTRHIIFIKATNRRLCRVNETIDNTRHFYFFSSRVLITVRILDAVYFLFSCKTL